MLGPILNLLLLLIAAHSVEKAFYTFWLQPY